MHPLATAILVLAFALAPTAAQGGGEAGKNASEVHFARQVWPILEKNCLECHQTASTGTDGKKKRPKGGVTLDSRQGIETSKQGKLVVGGKPDDSLLVHSISLPADDEDRMPPAKHGGPLAPTDIERIRTWIAEGADFGSWTGARAERSTSKDTKAGEGPPKDQKAARRVAGADLGLVPLDTEALAGLRRHFGIEPVEVGSALLRVTCYGREAEVDDTALLALAEHAPHVGELVLARTHVTDEGMATVARCANLTRLDLRNTKVGDGGARSLTGLLHLQSINLLGTDVGDEGLLALAACTRLEQVYVWQTPVSAAAVVAFRERVPTARVVFVADLPEPSAEAPVGGRARRR